MTNDPGLWGHEKELSQQREESVTAVQDSAGSWNSIPLQTRRDRCRPYNRSSWKGGRVSGFLTDTASGAEKGARAAENNEK